MLKTKNLNQNLIIQNLYKEYPDWMNDKLVFNNTSVLEICNEISRKFNITFTFSLPQYKEFLERYLNTFVTFDKSHEFKLTGDLVQLKVHFLSFFLSLILGYFTFPSRLWLLEI